MNLRLLSLTSATALLAITAAFGQSSPFPSISGQPQQPAAQSPFPPVGGTAPQQRQSSAFPPVGGAQQSAPSAFPSVNGSPPAMSSAPIMAPTMSAPGGFQQQQGGEPPCIKDFLKLREETEQRAKLVKAASDRHAPPEEACKVLSNFADADQKMLNYAKSNAASCGIPSTVVENITKNHAGVVQLRSRVCSVAANAAKAPRGPTFSDVLGSPTLPDANQTTRAGGSTFDTLNGNVLAR